jgi:hypothetical protein
MCSKLSRLMLILGGVLFVAATSAAFAEEVSISGIVRSIIDGKPINMIQVTIYRYHEDRELTHVFTGEDGKYSVSFPDGKQPVIVRFDTHSTLTNANDWNPSVVVNVEATKNTTVDRSLLPVGAEVGYAPDIDALNGYEFAAFWEITEPDKPYAQLAARRLGFMKLGTNVLEETRNRLAAFFSERAGAP